MRITRMVAVAAVSVAVGLGGFAAPATAAGHTDDQHARHSVAIPICGNLRWVAVYSTLHSCYRQGEIGWVNGTWDYYECRHFSNGYNLCVR